MLKSKRRHNLKDKSFNTRLKELSSQMIIEKSVNLSSFDFQFRNHILSLRVIEDEDTSVEIIQKYKYFDAFFVMKTPNNNYYLIDNQLYSDSYSPASLKLNDYNVYQRKQKIIQIENLSEKE